MECKFVTRTNFTVSLDSNGTVCNLQHRPTGLDYTLATTVPRNQTFSVSKVISQHAFSRRSFEDKDVTVDIMGGVQTRAAVLVPGLLAIYEDGGMPLSSLAMDTSLVAANTFFIRGDVTPKGTPNATGRAEAVMSHGFVDARLGHSSSGPTLKLVPQHEWLVKLIGEVELRMSDMFLAGGVRVTERGLLQQPVARNTTEVYARCRTAGGSQLELSLDIQSGRVSLLIGGEI